MEQVRELAFRRAPTAPDWDQETKVAFIAARFREIMLCLGLDLEDPSLAKTPQRVAEMYILEIFSGLDPDSFPSLAFTEEDFLEEAEVPFVFTKASFYSFCEHHFVPMFGTAYIAYLPNKKVIGLSKIPRLVRHFAKRPQLQERLTRQVADALASVLETDHVAVSLTAQHFCVLARGVEDQASYTVTDVFRGKFAESDALKTQFFHHMHG